MCLLGGWFTFLGPMLGAAILVALRTFASTFTEYWTLVQGMILMGVIIFLPHGVLGYLSAKFRQTEGAGHAGKK
jgi:branched-chain amino acid transport system permease protein